MYKIYPADCLDIMPQLPAGSIDAIISDPPYYQGMTANGMKGNFNDLAVVRPFFREFFSECRRLLSPKGSLYLFTDWRGVAFYAPIMEQEIGLCNMLVWDKRGGMGSYYTFSHELILFFTQRHHMDAGAGTNVIKGIPGFSGGAKKLDGEKVHPTQKPTQLISKLLTDCTEPGDTVLDCFMGSGTTGVCCERMGRNFIGVEIAEPYFEIAKHRIEQAKT